MKPPEKTALLIVDHGSSRPEAGSALLRVVEEIRALGRYDFVVGAHMDLEEPSIPAALDICFSQNADRVVIVPFMLAPGRHSSEDIPTIARMAFPDIYEERIIVAQPLENHPGVVDAVLERAELAIGKERQLDSFLISAQHAALLVIDLQTNLLPHIQNHQEIVAATRFLIRAARELEVPVHITEQYRKGLGPTDPRILEVMPESSAPMEKFCFGAFGSEEIAGKMQAGRPQLIFCGVEAHICVLQSALQAIGRGYDVFVVTDAIGSRRASDCEAALRRMEQSGVGLVSAEMAVYELLKEAGTPAFKSLLQMLKEGPLA